MSKYSTLSLWYLICMCVGLAAGWAEGISIRALMMSGMIVSISMAAIFATLFLLDKRKGARK